MITHDQFVRLSWTRWLKIAPVLTLDLNDVLSQHLGLVPDAAILRPLFRLAVAEHEEVYDEAAATPPDASAEPLKRRAEAMVRDAFQRVESAMGEELELWLFDWSVMLWSELNQVWDWFAYQTAMSIWYGSFRHRGVDLLGVGAADESILHAFEEHYIWPVDRFRVVSSEIRCVSLSDWDARMLKISGLTLEEDPRDPWVDLVEWLHEPLRRTAFQRFWPKFLGLLDPVSEASVHQTVPGLLRRQGIPDRPDRQLPLPSDLRAIPMAALE